MKNDKLLKISGILVISLLIVACFSSSIGQAGSGADARANMRFNYSVPSYQSDTVKVMNSYERLMNRYIGTVERHLIEIDSESETVITKLETIESKIDGLDERLARIEKALNIIEDIPAPPEPGPEEE